jgi:hypothetical protein
MPKYHRNEVSVCEARLITHERRDRDPIEILAVYLGNDRVESFVLKIQQHILTILTRLRVEFFYK